MHQVTSCESSASRVTGQQCRRPLGNGRLRKTFCGVMSPLWMRALTLTAAALILLPASSYAQASPWENAVNVLMVSFTGPIARGLSLVSIVIGGVTFAFGEGGSKRLVAGIVFGVGMAIGAVNFMAWLFP
jgi:type IV secretory pathway VirB2 component (pilin)